MQLNKKRTIKKPVTDQSDEEEEEEGVQEFRKVVNRRFSKLSQKMEIGVTASTKELALEERLREIHCRPLVKMFKFFNSDSNLSLWFWYSDS